MSEYEFILTFKLPSAVDNPADYIDALFEAGCDDATVGVGKPGSIALDFNREADTAENAIRSAIIAVKAAIPGAELTEVKPDLVNLSDIAEIAGCSRQNMRKYAAGEMRSVESPFPAPAFTGAPDLWHLAEVGAWLVGHTEFAVSAELLDVAAVAFDANVEIQQRRIERSRGLRFAFG